MNLEEFKNYSMKGKTFTIVDKQNNKRTIRISTEDSLPAMEIVETEDINLCSSFINIEFPKDKDDYYYHEDEDNTIEVHIREIVEIIGSPIAGIILVYNQDWSWEPLAASMLQHYCYAIVRGDYYFIPDKELKPLLKEIEKLNRDLS